MNAPSSVFQGGNIPTSQRRAPKSREMVERLIALDDPFATAQAMRVLACIDRRTRCGSRWHPACATRQAIAYRQRIECALRALPPSICVSHLTLTVAADELATGLDVLHASFARLRRLAAFAGVHGGMGGVEVDASTGSGARWLPHLHTVTWGDAAPLALERGVRPAWARLVAEAGAVGSAHVAEVARRFADRRETFRAEGVLRHQAPRGRLARARRRALARASQRAAAAAPVRSVRNRLIDETTRGGG